MITAEERRKIFGLYVGQNILLTNKAYNDTTEVSSSYNWRHPDLGLLLRPLSSISDEDAMEVGKILIDKTITQFDKRYFDSMRLCETFKFGRFLLQFDSIGDMDYRITKDKEMSVRMSSQLIIESTDYLRSRGYALPAFGYSVDELVSAGVFKLVEP